MKKVTLKDVARAAGVSLTSASFAMNGVKGRVSEEIIRKVQETSERLGYVPNDLAQRLRGNNARILALAYNLEFVDEREASTLQFVTSAVRYAKEKNLDILLKLMDPNDYSDNPALEYIHLWESRRVEGIMFLYCIPDVSFLESLNEAGVPYVAVEHKPFDRYCNMVSLDDYHLVQEGLSYIMGKQYDAVYFLTMQANEPSFREQAYLDFIKCNRLNGDVLRYQNRYRGKQQIRELVQPILPTEGRRIAILCWNDVDAINLMEVLAGMNIAIPDSVGVMGIDDLPAGERIHPALTTLRQPFDDMAHMAVDALLALKYSPAAEPVKHEIKGSLVIRESI